MIEEYSRKKAEAETEAEAMMIEKAKCIYRERAESEAKVRAKDDMRKQVWRAKYLGLRNSKNSYAETREVKPDTKSAVSEGQAMAKAETDIKGIVNRTRAAKNSKTKVNT